MADVPSTPLGDPARRVRRSSSRMVRTLSIAALLLSISLVSGCWGSRSGSHPTTTQRSQQAGLGELKRFDRYGITFEYPGSWFVTTQPISAARDPVYRFTVSTVRVRRTPADRGPCTPGIAKQLPPNGVLAYLRERLRRRDVAIELSRMTPRPRSFPLPTASSTALCGWARRGLWTPFKADGRAFYLGVYVGPKAPAATQRALKRMLDGMRIDPT
jgi:hypothetical protein